MTSRTLVLVARAQRSVVAVLAATLVLSASTVAVAGARPAARPADPASDAQSQVESARRAANAAGGRYMAALTAFERLRNEGTAVEAAITAGEERATTLRRIVQKRAARAYMRAGSSLPSLLTVDDLSDLMRTDKLLATANVDDADALALLRTQQEDLRVQRLNLAQLEDRQGTALAELQRSSRKADAQLATAMRSRQDVQARLVAQAASNTATARRAVHTTARRAPGVSSSGPVVQAPPSGGGTSSHHNDPFLSCVRQRESNGNYAVVNPSGPYYGAYQFLASTWNVSARHAGRIDLVGVIPSTASAFDQDEVAWSLYQWQGAGPWGGGC